MLGLRDSHAYSIEHTEDCWFDQDSPGCSCPCILVQTDKEPRLALFFELQIFIQIAPPLEMK